MLKVCCLHIISFEITGDKMDILHLATIIVCFIQSVFPANILIIPLNVNSHVVYFGQMGVGLVGQGHNVTLLSATSARVPSSLVEAGIKIHRYQGEDFQYITSKEMSQYLMEIALTDGTFNKIFKSVVMTLGSDLDPRKHWQKDCEGLQNDTKLLQILEDTKFDFAILDPIYPSCYYELAYKFDIPYAGFAIPYDTNSYGIPSLPSQVPSISVEFSDDMTFQERLSNFLYYLFEHFILKLLNGGNTEFLPNIRSTKPFKSPLELIQETKIHLYLADPVIEFPRPLMPNTLFVADVMGRDAAPLSADLEALLSSKHGATLVSFGSMMSVMPETISKILFEAFGNLSQTVIMKRAGNLRKVIPNNIKIMDWVPQNDILAHRKLNLFISHCGLNSLIEAVHHGKPILAIPFAGDQIHNAFLVEHKGIGKMLEIGKLTIKMLISSINEILHDKSYSDRAMTLSKVFRNKPETAAERVSHVINHVIQHGDSHLHSQASNINIFQYFMLDIFAVILTFVCLVITSLYCCFRCVLLAVMRNCRVKVKKQ